MMAAALLTGRWLPTAVTGGWTCVLAVVLGIPHRIWGTFTHMAFVAVVASVTAAATVLSAVA
jgi:hypothetical protein